MNIVDYILIAILILHMLKGFKNGLLVSVINFIGTALVFVIAFYIKSPISVFLYEKLPFLSFGGIFKGVVAVNILFYEAIAYGIAILLLGIVFTVIKRITKFMDKIISFTIFFNIPSKILGACMGLFQGILYSFLLLFVASVVNTTTTYVNNSKYGNIVLNKTPIISEITEDLVNSSKEIYNIVLYNKNNTNKANLESIDILMKYNILSYESCEKLVNDKKLNILGIENIMIKYKEVNND